MIPLKLFDHVLRLIEHKNNEKKQSIQRFMQKCRTNSEEQLDKLKNVRSQKTRKLVEQNVLATYINHVLEEENQKQFRNTFINRNLYNYYVKLVDGPFTSPEKFERIMNDILKAQISTSSFYQEYQGKLHIE